VLPLPLKQDNPPHRAHLLPLAQQPNKSPLSPLLNPALPLRLRALQVW
jgi:hypothetical protein